MAGSAVATTGESSFIKSAISFQQRAESTVMAADIAIQFRVLRQKGAEAPGSSPFDKRNEPGVYGGSFRVCTRSLLSLHPACAGCDAPLYTSKTKL